MGSINEHMPEDIYRIAWYFVVQFAFGSVWLMIIAGLTWPLSLKFSIDSQLPFTVCHWHTGYLSDSCIEFVKGWRMESAPAPDMHKTTRKHENDDNEWSATIIITIN